MSVWAVYSKGQNHRLTYTETLYCEATSKHTWCSVPAAPLGAGDEGGGWIEGSRVLMSTRFHYPIGTDLPSQHGLVLYVSTFPSRWKSVFQFLPARLFLHSLAAAAGISS